MGRKKKESAAEDVYSNLASELGGQLMSDVGKASYFIDTGNFALNWVCSGQFIDGGIPGGKLTEVYGPPASSKSLLGNCVLAGTQKIDGIAIYLDCERAGNAQFAQQAGHVDISKLLVFEPISLEQVESKIRVVTKKIREKFGPDKPICFVWDSIGVTPTEREWKEMDLPEEYTKAQFKQIVGSLEKPGERAKQSSALFRKLTPFLKANNVSLFVINQTRQKIGVLFGSDETTAGGGNALPFYASCRIRTSAHKTIEDKELEIPIGVNLKFANKKNRSFTPFLKTEGVQLYFEQGINPLGGLLSALLQSRRIKQAGRGMYEVIEPYADGKEVKFKASQERNDVPINVLLECPAVVDATSPEQIQEYLKTFDDAITLTNSGETAEKDINDEDCDLFNKSISS